jgi:TPR repeat protein
MTSKEKRYAKYVKAVKLHTSKNYKKAFNLFKNIAQKGNVRAQLHVALMYVEGKGVEQDSEKAIEWYTLAAKQGNRDAHFKLGELYYKGTGVEQDYTKALHWYTESANQGYKWAQLRLGNMYLKSIGVEQDSEKAVYWYTEAAKYGSMTAKYKLYDLAKKGKCTEQDYMKADDLYQKFNKSEDLMTDKELNIRFEDLREHYYNCHHRTAYKLLKKLADLEHIPTIQFLDEEFYFFGRKDHEQILLDLDLRYVLEKFYYKEDYATAYHNIQRLSWKGHAKSKWYLALMYYEGNWVAQDYEVALDLLLAAVKQGDDCAQYTLGNWYRQGEIVEKFDKRAKHYLRLSAKQGNQDARGDLEECYNIKIPKEEIKCGGGYWS